MKMNIFFAVLTLLFSIQIVASESDAPIGEATMLEDGTIVLNLRAETDGVVGHAQFTYKINEPEYKEVLEHIGGLKVGETKLVPPWVDK